MRLFQLLVVLLGLALAAQAGWQVSINKPKVNDRVEIGKELQVDVSAHFPRCLDYCAGKVERKYYLIAPGGTKKLLFSATVPEQQSFNWVDNISISVDEPRDFVGRGKFRAEVCCVPNGHMCGAAEVSVRIVLKEPMSLSLLATILLAAGGLASLLALRRLRKKQLISA